MKKYPKSASVRSAVFRSLFGLCLVASSGALQAQVTPVNSPNEPASNEVVQLSPFDVTTNQDHGYSSTNAIGATRVNIPIDEIPQNVAVINQQMIQDIDPNSISEVAQYVAGVTQVTQPGRDLFAIRGVVIAAPYTDGLEEIGSSQGTGLDMSIYDRIEIIKGPSAVIYGSTASGGVVNRVLKKPEFDKFGGSLDLEAGSWSHYKATIDVNQPFGTKNQFSARVIALYSSDLGYQDYDYEHRRFISPMFGWKIGPNSTLNVWITDLYDRANKPWGQMFTLPPYVGKNLTLSTTLNLPSSRDYAYPWSNQSQQARSYRFEWSTKINDIWSIRLAGVHSFYTYTEDPTSILRDLVIQNGGYVMPEEWRYSNNPVTANNLDFVSTWNFKLGPVRDSLVLLSQYANSRSETIQWLGKGPTGSTTASLPSINIFDPIYDDGWPVSTFLSSSTEAKGTSFGTALQDQVYFFNDRLIASGAIRYNRSTSQGLNKLTGVLTAPPASTKWTPQYGLVYRPVHGVSAYYSYSTTFTPIFTANPDGTTFTPPTSKQNEVGVKLDLLEGKISTTIAYYKRQDENTLVNDPDPLLASAGYKVQVPGDEMTGYEMDLYLNPLPALQFILGGSVMDAKPLSGLYITNIPKNEASGLAKYTFEQGKLKGLALGLGYVYSGRRAGDTANDFWLPSYGVFNGFATYHVGRYSYLLKVDNLANKWYPFASINRDIITAGPPRTITFSVKYDF